MARLHLSADEVLTTTRAVRKRLDFTRPVEREVLEDCLTIALQAPSGSNSQGWSFIVVTDPAKRAAIAEVYRRVWARYVTSRAGDPTTAPPERQATQARVIDSASYLAEHLHEVPVFVIPCIRSRTEDKPVVSQASVWGSILPAAWSFMLAARERGLGTVWTTLHLTYEAEVAAILDIPYAEIMQAALIPVAYTLGTDFKPAPRLSLEGLVHWETW